MFHLPLYIDNSVCLEKMMIDEFSQQTMKQFAQRRM